MLREREVGREKHQGKSEILMGCLLHRSSQKPGHVPRLETKQQPLGARNDTEQLRHGGQGFLRIF